VDFKPRVNQKKAIAVAAADTTPSGSAHCAGESARGSVYCAVESARDGR